MPISISNPLLSTQIFIAIFIIAILFSLRPKKTDGIFPLVLTQELKGLAILAVLFSHVGYFLSTDQRFLFPLTIMAGVGVNLFLFLSGYGLTVSSIKTPLPVLAFYKKRLLRLLVPFWLVISSFFALDFFLHHQFYGWSYMFKSMVGFFPRADVYMDVNSPFWFFTPILFYYVLFPLIFRAKHSWVAPVILYVSSYVLTKTSLPVTVDVMRLYQVHLLAFPLGMVFAIILPLLFRRWQIVKTWVIEVILQNKNINLIGSLGRIILMAGLLYLIGYTAYFSNVGGSVNLEQITSLVTMGAIVWLFILKQFEIKVLYLFGIYAYEIYLLHWPVMSHFDFLFKYLPGWLAQIGYLVFFIGLAWCLNKLVQLIVVKLSRKKV
ncbi:MAG: acyltransferase family protein [Candidatus Falkowbacteria bacterium]